MAEMYLWRKGTRELGPRPLADMKKMVRDGLIGRNTKVSRDNGLSWISASACGELWEGLVPVEPSPEEKPGAEPSVHAPPATQPVPPQPVIAIPGGAYGGDSSLMLPGESDLSPAQTGWGRGLAGFIITTTSLTLTLVPLTIWIMRYPAGYWSVPLIFPLLLASITGLVLSGTAMGKKRSGFATSGLVVGICGCALGLFTVIGWLVSNDPRTDWIVRLTSTAEADTELARRNFTSSLRRYREHAPNDDHAEALERVTKDLIILSRAEKRLLQSAASTPWFRRYFVTLESLQAAFISFSEAVKLQDGLSPQEAIDQIGESQTTLKELLDFWELYQTGQLGIDAVRSKFRDY